MVVVISLLALFLKNKVEKTKQNQIIIAKSLNKVNFLCNFIAIKIYLLRFYGFLFFCYLILLIKVITQMNFV